MHLVELKTSRLPQEQQTYLLRRPTRRFVGPRRLSVVGDDGVPGNMKPYKKANECGTTHIRQTKQLVRPRAEGRGGCNQGSLLYALRWCASATCSAKSRTAQNVLLIIRNMFRPMFVAKKTIRGFSPKEKHFLGPFSISRCSRNNLRHIFVDNYPTGIVLSKCRLTLSRFGDWCV